MKYFLSAAVVFLFASCSNSFINHEMKAVKMGACSSEITPIKMNSNINGERYEFEYCLDEDFDGKNYTIERKGDSLVVKFPPVTKKTALFSLTLDVDAKPAYHHITLGNQTLVIVPTDKF